MAATEIHARLLDKLDCLRALDPACAVFGAASHRYRLEPPVPLAQVAAFEHTLGISLPREYRDFILSVGSSGAGPDHGLLSLVEISKEMRSLDPARPARPFLLQTACLPGSDDARKAPPKLPEGASLLDGCLRLVPKGCGQFEMLVVTGERHGAIWSDSTVDHGPIAPSAPGFLAWYEEWLDWQLRRLLFEALRPLARNIAAGSGNVPVEEGGATAGKRDFLADAARFLPIFDFEGGTGRFVAMRGVVLCLLGRRAEAEEAFTLAAEQSPPPHGLEDLRALLHAAAFADVRARPPQNTELHARHPLVEIRAALAGNTATDEALLDRLAEDESPIVRHAALENPSTGANTIGRVFEGVTSAAPGDIESLFTLERIALHPRTADALRERLASWDGEPSEDSNSVHAVVRAAALASRAPETLIRLACHPAPAVRHAAAMNPCCPTTTLQRLAEDPDFTVRSGVAVNPSAPAALLEVLAKDPDDDVRAWVCGRQLAPATLIRLATEEGYRVASAVAANPWLPARCREVLLLHPRGPFAPWEKRGQKTPPGDHLASTPGAPAHAVWEREAFGHPSCPVALLSRILEGIAWKAAMTMAIHPWLLEHQLARLAEHSYSYVRQGIASHRRSPPDLLLRLSRDGDSTVRGTAARNPHLPVTRAIELTTDPDKHVRNMAGARPELPESILRQLASDPEARDCLLRRRDTPLDLLEQLAADADSRVRLWVPVSPRCPRSIAETLSRDSDPRVQKNARWRLLRDDLLASIAPPS